MGSTGMAPAAGRQTDGERRNVSDGVGVAVFAVCAAWSLITAAAHDGRPEGVLLAVLALAAGYSSGRILGALLPVAAPCAAALAGLGVAVALPHLAVGPQFTAPLGQSGAVAALLVLATGAACCAAWAASARAVRIVLCLLAAGIVGSAAALGPSAGWVLGAAVLLWSLAAGSVHRRGAGLLCLALAAALVVGGVWAVAENGLPSGLLGLAEGPLTAHRAELWHETLGLARRNLELGVGPGRSGELGDPTSQALAPDGKPHSAPLQQAAEQGLVGLALLAAAFCWVLYALWRTPRSTPVALTAGAALTALAALAAVGDALSFTTVTVGAGLLAGLATSRPLAGDTTAR